MHELHSNRAAVNAARFLGELALGRKIRMRNGTKKTEGIEVGFEISPAAEGFENAFTFGIGCSQHARGGRSSGRRVHLLCAHIAQLLA